MYTKIHTHNFDLTQRNLAK